jgi:hypothetical protein
MRNLSKPLFWFVLINNYIYIVLIKWRDVSRRSGIKEAALPVLRRGGGLQNLDEKAGEDVAITAA